MNKKSILAILLICVCVFAVGSACSNSQLSIEEFAVNEDKRFVEIGETFRIPSVSAKDSKGEYHLSVVTIKDPNGNAVSHKDLMFKPDILGDYTITYTVTLGRVREEKSFVLECFDQTVPDIKTNLMYHNIAVIGQSFDLSDFTASDLSGETITPTVTVTFGDEDVTPADGIITFDRQGSYVISVSAADSSSNTAQQEYVVYTEMNFEDGNFFENQWYVSLISSKHAYRGENSYQFGAFDTQITWFDDQSMFGELKILSEQTKLSAWIYFDTEAAGFDGSVLVNKQFFGMKVFDIYGDELPKNGDGKFEFKGNNWYRWLIDLADPLEDLRITDNLIDFRISLGVWDLDANSNAAKAHKVYIDNIRLIDDTIGDDEQYISKPLPPEDIYEKGALIERLFLADMLIGINDNQGGWVANSKFDYTIMHGKVSSELKKYDKIAWNGLGKFPEAGDPNQNGEGEPNYSVMESWRMFTGSSDGTVYALRANQRIIVEMNLQIAGNGKDTGNTAGYIPDTLSTISVYVLKSDGTLVKKYSSNISKADDLVPPAIVLEEGETFYYEYLFPNADSRNIQHPPVPAVYEAVLKAD